MGGGQRAGVGTGDAEALLTVAGAACAAPRTPHHRCCSCCSDCATEAAPPRPGSFAAVATDLLPTRAAARGAKRPEASGCAGMGHREWTWKSEDLEDLEKLAQLTEEGMKLR